MVCALIRLLILLFLLFEARAAVSPNSGGRCASFPCTWSIAGAAATAGELTELNNAFIDVGCGQTLKLTAGAVAEYVNTIVTLNKSCSAGSPATIETTSTAKLPSSNGRVNPNYRPVMPTIRMKGAASNSRFYVLGSGVKFRGIAFEQQNPSGSSGLSGTIWLGESSCTALWTISQNIPLTDIGDHKTYRVADPTKLPMLPANNDGSNALDGCYAASQLNFTPVFKINGVATSIVADMALGASSLLEQPYNPGTGSSTQAASNGVKTFWADGILTFRAARPISDVITMSIGISQKRTWADWPSDITFDQCIFSTPRLNQSNINGVFIQLQGQRIKVKNSYFDGGAKNVTNTGGEPKGISGAHGCLDCEIENNWIESSGMTVFYGGSLGAIYNDNLRNLALRGNALVKPDRWRAKFWAPNTYFEKEQIVVRDPAMALSNSSAAFIATTSGTTGSSEPSWVTTSCTQFEPYGSSTTDGGITWKCIDSATTSNLTWATKNVLEFKVGEDLTIEGNGMYGFWTHGQRYGFKLVQESLHSFGQRSTRTKNVTIRNNWFQDGYSAHGLGTDNSIFTLLGAGEYGYFKYANLGPLYMRNNAFINLQARWFDVAADRDGTCQDYGAFPKPHDNHVYVEHNLYDTSNNPGCVSGSGYVLVSGVENRTTDSSLMTFASNIFRKNPGESAAFKATNSQEGRVPIVYNYASLPTASLPAVSVPFGMFHKNIVVGASSATSFFPTSGSYNGAYPQPSTDNLNVTHTPSALSSIGFVSQTMRNFRLIPTSAYKRDGADGNDIGIDQSQIPHIWSPTQGQGKVDITVAGRKALVTFDAFGSAAEYPCNIVVSTTRDMENRIADLDLSSVAQLSDQSDADWLPVENNRRVFILGKNSSLSNGTYYTRTSCGGAVAFPYGFTTGSTYTPIQTAINSFTVSGALSGTATQQINRVLTHPSAVDMQIEYGTTYSRSTGTISGGGTATSSGCSTGLMCSVSFSANRGEIYYWRFKERNSGGTVLRTGRVNVQAIQ